MPTLISKTVKQSGGDYSTLDSALDGEFTATPNLVSSDKNLLITISGSWTVNDSTAVSFGTFTTDSTRNITITTDSASRHNGTANAVSGLNTYRLTGKFSFGATQWVSLTGIEVNSTGSSGIESPYGAFHGITVDSCIVHNCNGGVGAAGIDCSSPYNDSKYINNIVYNCNFAYMRGMRDSGGGNNQRVYNNTVYNCGGNSGAGGTYDSCYASIADGKNNIGMGHGAGGSDFASCGGNYHLSSDATAPGANSIKSKTSSNQFTSITASSENLHLKTGSDAIGVGTDLSAYFTNDIDGETRSAPWDIGADKYVSAGGGTVYASTRMMMGMGF